MHAQRQVPSLAEKQWHSSVIMALCTLLLLPQTVWYYPNEVYVDKEMLAKSRFVKADAEFGKAAHIQVFAGERARMACPGVWDPDCTCKNSKRINTALSNLGQPGAYAFVMADCSQMLLQLVDLSTVTCCMHKT